MYARSPLLGTNAIQWTSCLAALGLGEQTARSSFGRVLFFEGPLVTSAFGAGVSSSQPGTTSSPLW